MKKFIINLKTKEPKNRKKVFLFFCFFVFLSANNYFYFGINHLFAQDKIIAIVNNDVITQKDLKDFENFMRMQLSSQYQGVDLEKKIQSMEAELLGKLIEDKLIICETKKKDIKVDDNRIKAKINDIRKHYASDAEFQESLKSQGMVQADLESRIKEQMLMYSIIDSQIRNNITISPTDITAYYQKNPEQFRSPKEWELDALAIGSSELAFGIHEIIGNGKSFDDAAKENSLTVHRINMVEGQFKKEIEGLVSLIKAKDISEPVKIENKYYIFRMNKLIPERQRSLAESMDTIYNFLYGKRMEEEMAKWLDSLKKKAYIKVMQE